jgi:hypothetical protein
MSLQENKNEVLPGGSEAIQETNVSNIRELPESENRDSYPHQVETYPWLAPYCAEFHTRVSISSVGCQLR